MMEEKTMKRRMLCMAVVIVAMAVICTAAWAQYRPPVVLGLAGDAQIMKKGSAAWTPCIVGMAIAQDDSIKTGPEGSVTVGSALGRKNLVTIAPNSDAVVSAGDNIFAISLSKGEATVLVATLPKDSVFELRTPAAVTGAIGTGWSVWTDGQTTIARAHENTIYVKGIKADGTPMEENLYVDSGYQTTVKKYDAPVSVERLSPEAVAKWSEWREKVSKAFMEATQQQIDSAALVAEEASQGQ